MRDEKVTVGSRYQHFKGNIIKVIAIAKHSETLEEMVVYEHDGEAWVRPLAIFLSTEDISGRKDNITGQKYRFELIEK